MNIVVNQWFGYGDCIYIQTLVRKIADGRPIIWPVMSHFIDGLSRGYPDIQWVDYKTFPINLDSKEQYEINIPKYGLCTVLPIRFADYLLKVPYDECMAAKFKMYGIDYNTWIEDAMWERDYKKEEELQNMFPPYYKYRLINDIFGSESKHSVSISDNLEMGNIRMNTVPGFSLFDWAKIIENANEIHVVNSSIIYLLEQLELKAPEVHLYQRSIPGQTFSNISYLLKKHKYIFHG